MSEPNSLQEMIRRLRGGDEAAAADFLRQYEPTVRRAVRVRMVNAHLRRTLESMDISQSVFASFFVRMRLGHYELDNPAQLVKLLVSMVRNKVAGQIRRELRQRRDQRRLEPVQADDRDLAAPGPTPSQQVSAEELVQAFRRRLSEEERGLADQRAEGREWAEIAAARGVNPDALRKQLARAVQRVARELGVEELSHDP